MSCAPLTAPDLDRWLPAPVVRIHHQRPAAAAPDVLWAAAQSVRLSDTRRLGRLVRLRIPGLPRGIAYHALFRAPPFIVLDEDELSLLAGIVGRIWTLRRDYPVLAGAEEFRSWSGRGTVRVLFANWVAPAGDGGSVLVSETRVATVDRIARVGLAALQPLIAASQGLIASDGIELAVQRAERG